MQSIDLRLRPLLINFDQNSHNWSDPKCPILKTLYFGQNSHFLSSFMVNSLWPLRGHRSPFGHGEGASSGTKGPQFAGSCVKTSNDNFGLSDLNWLQLALEVGTNVSYLSYTL